MSQYTMCQEHLGNSDGATPSHIRAMANFDFSSLGGM